SPGSIGETRESVRALVVLVTGRTEPALGGHADLPIARASSGGTADERRVNVSLTKLVVVRGVGLSDRLRFTAQEAHVHARRLEGRAHLRKVCLTFPFGGAAILVLLARMGTVPSSHAIHAQRVAEEISVGDARIAI